MYKLLQKDPKLRITAEEALKHNFFDSFSPDGESNILLTEDEVSLDLKMKFLNIEPISFEKINKFN